MMMKRTLSGLRKAAYVTCDSVATREELLAHGLVRPERSAVVRNGVHPSCSAAADPAGDAEAARLLSAHPPRSRRLGGESLRRQNHRRDAENAEGSQRNYLELLHVGSTIPRKRIDLLLRVFASVKEQFPNARLVRVGGAFTSEQVALAEELKILDSIAVLPHIEREVLAAVYRRAALVLLPSEREGFGLPVIEALACGTPVVATDLPVLREVGGDAAAYCPLSDINAWSRTIGELLLERSEDTAAWAARQQRSVAQAARFSWADYARSMTDIYQEVLQRAYLRDRKDLPQRAQRGIHEITRT
jgi:glycosyltransferase involved in cell wall biosynthesis